MTPERRRTQLRAPVGRPGASGAVHEPEDVNVGADEEVPIKLVSDRFSDIDVPATGDAINVTFASAG